MSNSERSIEYYVRQRQLQRRNDSLREHNLRKLTTDQLRAAIKRRDELKKQFNV